MKVFRLIVTTFFVLGFVAVLYGQRDQLAEKLVPVLREEMLARAKLAAEHTWVCREKNTRATCQQSKPYKSDFKAGETVQGIAYDWGGMDDPAKYDQKLAEGQAAGSHSRHGVTRCTTGIDCSGFVSFCWKQPQKYGTSNIRQIAGRAKYNWFTDLKPGDALNKAGSHIVLFVEYDGNGQPIVYEARGGRGKVVKNTRTWNQLKGYIPLQYKNVVEDD